MQLKLRLLLLYVPEPLEQHLYLNSWDSMDVHNILSSARLLAAMIVTDRLIDKHLKPS